MIHVLQGRGRPLQTVRSALIEMAADMSPGQRDQEGESVARDRVPHSRLLRSEAEILCVFISADQDSGVRAIQPEEASRAPRTCLRAAKPSSLLRNSKSDGTASAGCN